MKFNHQLEETMIAENKVSVQVRIGWIGFKQLQGRGGIPIWIK